MGENTARAGITFSTLIKRSDSKARSKTQRCVDCRIAFPESGTTEQSFKHGFFFSSLLGTTKDHKLLKAGPTLCLSSRALQLLTAAGMRCSSASAT